MENVTLTLLENYYGFGGEKKEGKSLSSHEGFMRELGEGKSGDIDVNGNLDDEDTLEAGQSSETKIDDSNENNGTGNGVIKPWRSFTDDDFINDEIADDEEVDLELENSEKDNPEDGKPALPKLMIPDKGDWKDEPTELGIIEDGIPDTASDISTLSTKKKTRKKSRLSSSGRHDPPQQLILMPPVAKNNPIINKEFCDMTNASIIEFPVNLLEEISSIRMLYLENNSLNELPDQLFTSLTFLQWLDVRNNWLKTLPATIKNHQCLETILLQGNRIEKLPLELCHVPNLKTLHTAGNPLISPPPDVIAQGFTTIMKFLRKEWNKEYPNDPVSPPQEVKSTSTIFCDDPPVLGSSRPSRFLNRSSTSCLSKSLKTLSTREKSRNYKPSNRYDASPSKEYDLLELNYRSKMNQSPDILCDDCRERIQNSSTYSSRDEWDCFIDYQQIKIKMRERLPDEYESSRSSTPSKRDVGVVANIKPVEEKKNCVKLPKIRERNFTSDVKRLEDIKVKERVYKVMTNDRIMTKLRPMRLSDPDWILAFIENYLGVENRPMGCRSSGGSSMLEEKLRWISKVREMLIKQADEIQRIRDREVLREWRGDRRSYEKSMEKAASRGEEGIPFAINYSDTPFLTVKKLQKSPENPRRRNIRFSGDMDKKMFEIIESLQHYKSKNQSQHLSSASQLQILQSEIRRIENLYEEIQSLKRQNDVSQRKYNGPNISARAKSYNPPPSIIV